MIRKKRNNQICDFYTADEVASKLGIATTTWREWVKLGRAPLPLQASGGRLQRWSIILIDQWIDDGMPSRKVMEQMKRGAN
jgi:predicted DNA-binding transcriptional regulator AlpA